MLLVTHRETVLTVFVYEIYNGQGGRYVEEANDLLFPWLSLCFLSVLWYVFVGFFCFFVCVCMWVFFVVTSACVLCRSRLDSNPQHAYL